MVGMVQKNRSVMHHVTSLGMCSAP
ncbi:hypothetical protein Zm00014a_014290 [Zea mays]|uniref:Uncharacterized protein n=1 Tax=Zea mays TaxID=4577 RepID=A0A3L6EP01_MAIZE|nr:hypothetical protein Zm00014a_014290 [Zea mays]